MAINDILTEVGIEGSVTTLSAPGKSIGVYNINVGSTANWPSSGKTVYFAMRTINPSAITASSPSGQIAGTYSSWKGIVGTNAITSMVLQSGSTDQTYAAGSNTQVFIPVSAARENALVTWGQVHADNLGNLKTSAVQSALGLTNLNGYTPLGATFASVVYNGNRSYTGTITGTDYTNVLSPGMRLQITRSTAAPTQSTSLNGTTQYWSKTAPNGMTFVDNFTCSGWVKLTSYPTIDGSVISRYNGTSGWVFHIVANTGQVRIGGLNSPNSKIVTTYQSIPLNKWVHIAGTLNMAGSLGNLYIDGVLAPSTISGTATSLLQVGNLEIGTYNATAFFPGQIAQAAVFSSVLSATTIQNYYSQGLLGTEPTLISAYSFNGTPNDLNSTNANNLTSNAAAGYTTSSPFSTQASGIPNGLNDYAEIVSATFSTNTIVVFRATDVNTIPTIGGIASVVYSSNLSPYGYPTPNTVLGRALTLTQNILAASYTTYGTVTASTGGNDIEIVWTAQVANGNSGADRTFNVQVLMDGATTGIYPAVLTYDAPFISGTTTTLSYTFTMLQTPAAGNHTWNIQLLGSAAGSVVLTNSIFTIKKVG